MHALLVVAHPEPGSLTHAVAASLAAGVTAGGRDSAEIADLAAEGFDPRFTAADHAAFNLRGEVPADVRAEQARIDRADALVLVFPVYWWSLPALMKGWIDRVFCNGWAYGWSPETGTVKKLGHLPVHLVALGASAADTYERRGYFEGFRTQVEQGMFDYCGAPVASATFLHGGAAEAHLATAGEIGRRVFDPAAGTPPA